MEYVRGRTLREVLAERRRLNPVEALAILEQMLAAIAAAHRAGLVHRDVKPENVLVAEAPSGGTGNLVDSVVKVADFGLARAVEASADDDDGGQLMATVAYVAPELVTDGHADPRTDVYSAGIVLFEMLTGRVPYDGDQPVEVAWQHVDRDVPPPSTVRRRPAAGARRPGRPGHPPRPRRPARPTPARCWPRCRSVRDDLGAANAETALLRQVAGPTARRPDSTVNLPRVEPADRPGPGCRGRPAAAADQPGAGAGPPQPAPRRRPRRAGARLGARCRRLDAAPARPDALAAAIVVMGLLAAIGGWWFGIGRYTERAAAGRA